MSSVRGWAAMCLSFLFVPTAGGRCLSSRVTCLQPKPVIRNQTPVNAQQWPSYYERHVVAISEHKLEWRTLYCGGEIVQQDFSKALECFMKAADQSEAVSQHNLGGMYASRLGVGRSWVETWKWFQKTRIAARIESANRSLYNYR